MKDVVVVQDQDLFAVMITCTAVQKELYVMFPIKIAKNLLQVCHS
jgi:hypothetical protein